MPKSKFKKSKNVNKKVFLALLVIILLAVGLVFYFNNREKHAGPSVESPNLGETINFNPPSEQDKQEVDQHKQDIVSQEQQTPKTSNSVKPIIIDAGFYDGQVEVRSFISGTYEAGGTCSVKLTKAGQSIVKDSKSVKGATTTDCPPTIIPSSELSSGTWAVVVSYSSTTTQGSSDIKTVEVK